MIESSMKAVLITKTGQSVTFDFTETSRLFSISWDGTLDEVPRPSWNGRTSLDIEEMAPGAGRYPMVFILCEPTDLKHVVSLSKEDGLKLIAALQMASEIKLAELRKRTGHRPH